MRNQQNQYSLPQDRNNQRERSRSRDRDRDRDRDRNINRNRNNIEKNQLNNRSRPRQFQNSEIDTKVCKRCHLQNLGQRKKCIRYIGYDQVNKKIIRCSNNLYPNRIADKIINVKGLKPNYQALNSIQLPLLKNKTHQSLSFYVKKFKNFKVQRFNVERKYNAPILPKIHNFKILTYNIWGNQIGMYDRFPLIIQEIVQANADFICIQQTYQFRKQGFLNLLINNLKNNGHQFYFINPQKNKNSCYYATILLSRYPGTFYEITMLDQKSKQDKPLKGTIPFTMGLFQFQNQKNEKITISVNSLHLKSNKQGQRQAQQIRLKQIELFQVINQQIDISISAGDMNFRSNKRQQQLLTQTYEYIDLQRMIMINPDKYHTYQYKKQHYNQQSQQINDSQKYRFDRIYIKNSKITRTKFQNTLRVQGLTLGDKQIAKGRFEVRDRNEIQSSQRYSSQEQSSHSQNEDQSQQSYQDQFELLSLDELSDHKMLTITISF